MSKVKATNGDFDDAPQWYWSVLTVEKNGASVGRANERFIVACGQRELWERAKAEFGVGANCSWMPLGPRNGAVSLADCTAAILVVRECYGVSFNRMMLELARIPAWAKFVDEAPGNLCDYVSNPTTSEPLPRGPYDKEDELELQTRIARTLGRSCRAAQYED